jgi:1,4-dihydroxy-2-naphthoyl-CoA hydrolase
MLASVSEDELTRFMHDAMPLCSLLGMTVQEMGPERVVMSVEWSEQLCTSGGLLHGGLIMALADSAGAACASVNLPEGATGTSTIESKTNFLGAVREGRVVATSRPLHAGNSTVVIETEVRRAADDRLVAKVTQTQIVLHAKT